MSNYRILYKTIRLSHTFEIFEERASRAEVRLELFPREDGGHGYLRFERDEDDLRRVEERDDALYRQRAGRASGYDFRRARDYVISRENFKLRERYAEAAFELALDGGPARLGVASTIVNATGERPRILREGALSAAAIEEACHG